MKTKPWIAIDLMTNEVIGNYVTEIEAQVCNLDNAVSIQYAPRAREVR